MQQAQKLMTISLNSDYSYVQMVRSILSDKLKVPYKANPEYILELSNLSAKLISLQPYNNL